MRKINGLITIKEIEDRESNLNFLRTKLDMESESIISSEKYSEDDVHAFGWNQIVEWVQEDNEKIEQYNRGLWDLKYWRLNVDISTSMDGVRHIHHKLALDSPHFFSTDPEDVRINLRNDMILDMFESLTLLGFTKHQFTVSLPELLQPVFRRLVLKVKKDGRR